MVVLVSAAVGASVVVLVSAAVGASVVAVVGQRASKPGVSSKCN